jgi:hypothetical protein
VNPVIAGDSAVPSGANFAVPPPMLGAIFGGPCPLVQEDIARGLSYISRGAHRQRAVGSRTLVGRYPPSKETRGSMGLSFK